MTNQNFSNQTPVEPAFLYESAGGLSRLEAKVFGGEVWLTQEQISEIFGKSRSTIAEHISNIFKNLELDEKTACRLFRNVGRDGKDYNVKYYGLEIVLFVGYRVNSEQGNKFRLWCARIIKNHILNRPAA